MSYKDPKSLTFEEIKQELFEINMSDRMNDNERKRKWQLEDELKHRNKQQEENMESNNKLQTITLEQMFEKQHGLSLELFKSVYAKGATDEELKLFLTICTKRNLNPLYRQIYFVKINEKQDDGTWKQKMNAVTSVDGLRTIADRTRQYQGQTLPEWCGKDGKWVDIWTTSEPPFAARVGVYKQGCVKPFYGIALFDEYKKTKKDGTLTKFWKEMSAHMIAKVAECLALRKAFPEDLSGIYTKEELDKNIVDDDHLKNVTPKNITLETEIKKEPLKLSDAQKSYLVDTIQAITKDLPLDEEKLVLVKRDSFIKARDELLANQNPDIEKICLDSFNKCSGQIGA